MIDVTFRPIDQWPGVLTSGRTASPFRAGWADTLDRLDRELSFLHAERVVIQLALTPGEIRNDGWPRSGAKPEHPGVILAFESMHGPLKYVTDHYRGRGYWGSDNATDGWQANARAIALGLEALRKVDRYGITKHGEQYTGWSALPPAREAGPAEFPTIEAAAEYLIDRAGSMGAYEPADLLDDHARLSIAYRLAAKATHPDTGGDSEEFHRVQVAHDLIEAESS